MSGAAKAQSDDFQDRLDSSTRAPTIGNLVFGAQGTCVATLVASDLVVTSAQCVIETTNPENISSIPLSFRYFPLDGGRSTELMATIGLTIRRKAARGTGTSSQRITSPSLGLNGPLQVIAPTPQASRKRFHTGGRLHCFQPPKRRVNCLLCTVFAPLRPFVTRGSR